MAAFLVRLTSKLFMDVVFGRDTPETEQVCAVAAATVGLRRREIFAKC
jgi:hypothetical protein